MTQPTTVPFVLPESIETPTVVVDVDVLEHNISSWAAQMAERKVGLRPHTKTLSEHHCVGWTTGPRPAIGDVVSVIPNHACVVVNLADELTAVTKGEIVDIWPVASRGMNS